MKFTKIPEAPFIEAKQELQRKVYRLWKRQVEQLEATDLNCLTPTELAATMDATTQMWREMEKTGWHDDVWEGDKSVKAVKITLKGRALTAAVESGLIRRKLSGDIPMRKFERFWALFSPWLSTDAEQGDDLYQMVKAPADSAADDEKQEVTPE